MESFRSPEQEVVFLFGHHALDQALKKGPEYYVRRVSSRDFREAVRGLRARLGPERARFCHSLPPDLAGALIHAMLDPVGWDKLVLAAAVEKLPTSEPDSRNRKLRPVQRRSFRTSKLDH